MTTESQPLALDPNTEEPSFIRRRPVRVIIYVGLALFVLMVVVWPLVVQLSDPDFQKHIEQHRVLVGMTKEQVLKSWGGPQTINTTFTKDGIRQEEWIFEDWESSAIVRHRYLYFEEGTLMGGWYEGSRERRSRDFPAEKPHPKIQP
ncbi:MAG: hypothetical protein OEV27_12050 [Nitrospira sp.]|nr:hypothetical protein [Nitrospira sp.]MDH4251910.1 hypothetical protein [Nitrospira sp.]MDH5336279.1 hypothetical protein [Nitrospira sp.]